MSTTHQKPTAPAQPSHSIAQKMLNTTPTNLYQMIVQGERGIVASEYKAKPSDPHCDVRQNLTAIQLALLATLEDDHQDKVIEELREDSDGVEGGFWIDDDAFKAMIQRCSRMI